MYVLQAVSGHAIRRRFHPAGALGGPISEGGPGRRLRGHMWRRRGLDGPVLTAERLEQLRLGLAQSHAQHGVLALYMWMLLSRSRRWSNSAPCSSSCTSMSTS